MSDAFLERVVRVEVVILEEKSKEFLTGFAVSPASVSLVFATGACAGPVQPQEVVHAGFWFARCFDPAEGRMGQSQATKNPVLALSKR